MRLLAARLDRTSSPAPRSRGAKLLWALSNLLMLVGLVLLLYVGGLYTQVAYQRYAARGDTPLPAPRAVAGPLPAEIGATPSAPRGAAPSQDGQIVGTVPDAIRAAHRSTITRVTILSIGVDSDAIEVSWETRRHAGQPVAVWQG